MDTLGADVVTVIVECRTCGAPFEVDVMALPAGQWWKACPYCHPITDEKEDHDVTAKRIVTRCLFCEREIPGNRALCADCANTLSRPKLASTRKAETR